MYDLNINKLGFELLEPHRRRPKFLALLYVLLSPFKSIYEQFTTKRERLLFEMAITAQVHSLEYYLNDIYGLPYVVGDRDALIAADAIIYIEDTSNLPFTWVDNEEALFVGNGTEAFVAGQSAYELHSHYKVLVPDSISYNTKVLAAEINKFNHVNRKFTIEEY